jgi:hypothetical protein
VRGGRATGLQLFLDRLDMVLQRLEWILRPAEHASEPGQDLLLLEPLAPSRILGAANALDHGEIAKAQDLAPSRHHSWGAPPPLLASRSFAA